MKAVNVAVGNCRYTGGGWPATPKANPEDGLLDVVIIETLGAGELLGLAPAALAEFDYLDKDGIFFARAKDVYVETQPPAWSLPPTARSSATSQPSSPSSPQALKVLVGPDYVPEPEG